MMLNKILIWWFWVDVTTKALIFLQIIIHNFPDNLHKVRESLRGIMMQQLFHCAKQSLKQILFITHQSIYTCIDKYLKFYHQHKRCRIVLSSSSPTFSPVPKNHKYMEPTYQTSVGPTVTRPVQDLLTFKLLNNLLYIQSLIKTKDLPWLVAAALEKRICPLFPLFSLTYNI